MKRRLALGYVELITQRFCRNNVSIENPVNLDVNILLNIFTLKGFEARKLKLNQLLSCEPREGRLALF